MSDDTTAKTEDTKTEPQGSQPATPQGNDGGKTEIEPTFTQTDIDRIAAKTRSEARSAAISSLLGELGLENLDGLKSLVTKSKERDEAEMSEVEKLNARLEKLEKEKQDAIAAHEATQQQMIANQQKQAFIKAANASGGQNVDDLFILIQAKYGDDFKAVFDNGTPDDKKMESFIKQIQSGFSSYFGTSSAGSPSNAGGVAPTSQALAEQTRQEIKRKYGKF